MVLLIRMGAYLLSGLLLWQVVEGGSGMTGDFAAGRHLFLDPEHGMIFGVCAGFANYSGIDISFIRLLWALVAIYRGVGVGLYILAFLILPMPS
ncbi:MAG: PspC domain-containing protein [Negativicutes bacterium]|nr:PspC domain-containing protein [Negativicutes bacterium]